MNQVKDSMHENLTEQEIDRMVEQQADDDSAWEETIQVSREKDASLPLTAELAARAAFLAKLHKEKGTDEWLTRIIRERIELEESAYAEAKRELSKR